MSGFFDMTLEEYQQAFPYTDILFVHDAYKVTTKKVETVGSEFIERSWNYEISDVSFTGTFYVSLVAPNTRFGCPWIYEEDDDNPDLKLFVQDAQGGNEVEAEYNKENGLNSITATVIATEPGRTYTVRIRTRSFTFTEVVRGRKQWTEVSMQALVLSVYAPEAVSIAQVTSAGDR
eukprot:TRINITY_DN12472_c0_g1_i1.p1 TRINITY_DN12472_c0_g1~~TRINITY_DN12472_c0_g1_i1.p1  ORF type:complete len:176 (-),score=29.08 TRINITY_DN12472_c0_g1_i1:174-701(-)